MSYGRHPLSGAMVSDNKEIYAMSTLDIIIDIKGMFFRCRSLSYAKNLNVTDEHGTGGLDPYALVNQEHTYNGTLTYASFLVDDTPALTTHEVLALRHALLNQKDEGRAEYFHIYTMEVPGRHDNDAAATKMIGGIEDAAAKGNMGNRDAAGLGFIEALLNCKVTKFNRDYADKSTIVSSVDFKYMYGIPK